MMLTVWARVAKKRHKILKKYLSVSDEYAIIKSNTRKISYIMRDSILQFSTGFGFRKDGHSMATKTLYTLIVADDEDELREAVCTMVPWQEYGFKLLGSASNGLEDVYKRQGLNGVAWSQVPSYSKDRVLSAFTV